MRPSEVIKEKLQIDWDEFDKRFIERDELYLFAEKVLMYLNTPERFKASDLEMLAKNLISKVKKDD